MKAIKKTPIGASVVRHFSAFSVIIAFVLAIVGAFALLFGQQWQTEYGGWALLQAAYWVAILYLVWLLLTRPPPEFLGTPKVKMFKDGILYVEDGPWLGIGVMTAIYLMEDDSIERLVCAGDVIHVQTNGLVQIRIRYDLHGYPSEEEAQKALINSKDRILVKPGLYRSAT